MATLHPVRQLANWRAWPRQLSHRGPWGGYSALLWLAITLLFLYERTYLIQKAGLPHFVACAVVRVGLLMGLCYAHLCLAERLLPQRQYRRYALLAAAALAAYLLLQGAYDRYLFGFVIGDQQRQGIGQNLPYNLITTSWYLLLTYLVARRPTTAAPNTAPATPPATSDDEVVTIKTGGEWRQLPVASIRYVQGLKDYCVLHTPEGRHMVKGSIGKVAEWLPAGQFVRVHKSYLVAQRHIQAVSSTEVRLDTAVVPIGRVYAGQLAFFKGQGTASLA